MIEAVGLEASCCLYFSYLLPLIPPQFQDQPAICLFECSYLILECFMLHLSLTLIPFTAYLGILFYCALWILTFSVNTLLCVLGPFTTYCLQVTERRIISRMPIILIFMCHRARTYWWYLSWWTFLRLLFYITTITSPKSLIWYN